MTRKQIGFTLDKTDEVKTVEEAPKRSLKGQALFAMVPLVLIGGFVGTIVKGSFDRQEERAIEKAKTEQVVVTETKKIEPLKVSAPKAEESIVGNEAVKLYGENLVSIFNKELQSTKENDIFKSEFNIKDERTLRMVVDTESASNYFGKPEETVNLGISQGADAYRIYLQRFNNRIWNGKGEGLKLEIVNTRGDNLRTVEL